MSYKKSRGKFMCYRKVFLLIGFIVLVFSSFASAQHDYKFVTMWGSRGRAHGQFIEPVDAAIDKTSGNIYVVDKRNHRIQKFNKDGIFISAWGNFGTQYGQFKYPSGIAVDSTLGFVYVSDFRNHRIQKFDLDGNWLATWGKEATDGSPRSGSANKEFSYPRDVACNPGSGYVYAVDQKAVGRGGLVARIQSFTSDGVYQGSYEYGRSVPFAPDIISLAVGERTSNVYGLEEIRETVKIFDKDLTSDLGGWGGTRATPDESLFVPMGLAVDSAENVYTCERTDGCFKKFTSDGTFLSKTGERGRTFPGEMQAPEGIAVTHDGRYVYVCDTFNHRIQKFKRMIPELGLPTRTLPRLRRFRPRGR